MEKALLLYIFLFYWHFLNALFTVEAPQSLYTVEHGNNVTMECTFPVNGKLKFRDLSVSWEKKDELKKQVYVLLKGEEDFKSQHSDFRGRIKLLKENLNLGQSLLQITDVKLRDAGFYRCIIGYGGADYKTINLKVKAPYRTITQRVVSTGDNKWKLTCQSEGYPQAEVIWQNRKYEDLTDKANTSYETGSDQRYRVTSTLTIKSRIDEIFYCIFWNKELQENTSAVLHIAVWIEGRCMDGEDQYDFSLDLLNWAPPLLLLLSDTLLISALYPDTFAQAFNQAGKLIQLKNISVYQTVTWSDSADGVRWTDSRRFVGAILIVAALFGSVLLFMLCIKKARANKDNRTPVASSSIAKLSKDKDTHDCRDASFEDEELKYMQIEKT